MRTMLTVVFFLCVTALIGSERGYPSFDPIAIGPLPFMMWSSTTKYTLQ